MDVLDYLKNLDKEKINLTIRTTNSKEYEYIFEKKADISFDVDGFICIKHKNNVDLIKIDDIVAIECSPYQSIYETYNANS